jgi:hypothetical protein
MFGEGEQPHLSTAEAAKFATLAYVYGSGKGNEDEKRAEVREKLEGSGWEMRFDLSNRQLSVLYNKNEDHLHIAHKGTQPNSSFGMMDLVSDLKLGMAQESSSYQFNYRLQQSEKIYQSVKPKVFTMSGHSLGGATMIYALEKSRLLRDAIDQADTFNAGANPWPNITENLKYLNPFKYRQYKREDEQKAKKLNEVVTHHRMEKDFVSVSMRAKPPHGEVRMYPLSEAVGEERQDELKKMNVISKGLEAHHLHHFEDDASPHMQNYKSSNYTQDGSGRKLGASKPAPSIFSPPGGTRARTKLVYARPEDIKKRIRRHRSISQVIQPYMDRTRDDEIPNSIIQELMGPFRRLKEDIEDEDALSAFASRLNSLLRVRSSPEDTAPYYVDIGDDAALPSV